VAFRRQSVGLLGSLLAGASFFCFDVRVIH
jgi:hypothetical protein